MPKISVTKHFPKTVSLKDTSQMTMITNHLNAKNCGKTFVPRCRLQRHLNGHETQSDCYYFNSDKDCPFDKIGCKFQHKDPRGIGESLHGRTDISDKKSWFSLQHQKSES